MTSAEPKIPESARQRARASRFGAREIIVTGVVPIVFIVAGIVLEHSPRLEPARNALRTESGPAGTTGSKVGRILEQLGIETDGDNFGWTPPEQAPSTLAVEPSRLRRSPLALSLVADEADLNDPETGIQVNGTERGRHWERVAFVSYFRFGELLHATRIGLRRHGGATRVAETRPSWRFYFRGEYGSEFDETSLFGDEAGPMSRIVVRRTGPRLPNLMGFEIARANGAPTPAFVPARLLLNGAHQGHYLLTEHVNPAGWGRSQFGHDDYSMFVYRGLLSTSDQSVEHYAELADWVSSTPAPMTMEAAGDRVDLDKLVRHMFTFLFCGTQDWAQGAAVRDESRPGAKWFFVHWDLDQSFPVAPGWQAPAIEGVLYGRRRASRNDLRARLVRRLLAEDPEFRVYFATLATELLDRNLTDTFLSDLLGRYEYMLRPEELADLREFFSNRPAVLRGELADLLDRGAGEGQETTFRITPRAQRPSRVDSRGP